MHEIVLNLHVHTQYSDGGGLHRDIARAALEAGLDVVIVTDHNVLVDGVEGYYKDRDRRVLLVVGEEVHDPARQPQKNHMLVLGVAREMAAAAPDPQAVIDQVRALGGLSFLAHPTETAAPLFDEPDISWVDWNVKHFSGLEVWNALSEFKDVIPTRLQALFLAFFPALIARGPRRATLDLWDEQLATGRAVVGIGGSDAHATLRHLGPWSRVIFPYGFHFRGINNHVLLHAPLSGDLVTDRGAIYTSLREGRSYVGYDMSHTTRGFRYSAHGLQASVTMGEEIRIEGGVTLQAHLPAPAEIRLIRDGHLLRIWPRHEAFTFAASEPGAYRVEAYRSHLGRRRGWIFSNPIYVR